MGATVTWMQSMPFWWQSGNVAVLIGEGGVRPF
jgi:serine/threonine protein phosphatase 1